MSEGLKRVIPVDGRTITMSIRLSPEERQALQVAADKEGYLVSVYVRRIFYEQVEGLKVKPLQSTSHLMAKSA